MSVTDDVSHEPMSWLNDAPENILSMLVTDDVSQFEISLSKTVLLNIAYILVTEDVSQKPISELKDLLLLKRPDISVTNVVHRFALPLAISAFIESLSTTV